jgi:predicted small lipoprotein YifL
MLRVILALALMTSLAACGTRLNPLNWFGADREQRVSVAQEAATPTDPRQLVGEVVDLAIAPTPQGAILRAMGRPPAQGYWEAGLVEVERTATTLVYEFRVFPPLTATAPGTPQSREVVTGVQLSSFDLAGIRSITVIAAQNRRSVSR